VPQAGPLLAAIHLTQQILGKSWIGPDSALYGFAGIYGKLCHAPILSRAKDTAKHVVLLIETM